MKGDFLMKSFRILMVLMWALILVAGCSQEADMTAPETSVGYDKDGQEMLGTPLIPIADGTCFAQGGVGMVGKESGQLEVDMTGMPDVEVMQVLLYWSGGTTTDAGSGMVSTSTVTCRSCMASNNALWVRGVALLISSANTIWDMIGPGRNSNSWVFWLK